jgi:hypothetical protein
MDKNMREMFSTIAAGPVVLNSTIDTRLIDRARPDGEVCDCCGKTLAELQIPSFSRCGRCKMVFYCSPACQQEHWKKKGHKEACRNKNGQIEIGDDMQLPTKNPDGTTITKFKFVKVISCVGRGDQWRVQQHGLLENVLIVNGSDLLHIRLHSTL